MKIAITGEGPTDYGKKDFVTGDLVRGAAEGYAETIAQEQCTDIDWYYVAREDVQRFKLSRSLRGLEEKAVPARRFVGLLQTSPEDIEGAIYYCDADRDSGTDNSSEAVAHKRYDGVYQQVLEGLEVLENAIPMIPLRIIENWILGDKNCLKQDFHIKNLPDYSNKTELLWGDKRNPESNYPKCIVDRIRKSADKRYQGTSFYEISKDASIAELKKNCEYSYGRFYDDFVALINKIMLGK